MGTEGSTTQDASIPLISLSRMNKDERHELWDQKTHAGTAIIKNWKAFKMFKKATNFKLKKS